jgi:hypothetical protein
MRRGTRQRKTIEQLMEALAAEAPPALGMRAADLRPEPPPPHSARATAAERFGVPSACLEISYHQCQSGVWLTPDHYRALGAALARAIYRQALGVK